MTFSSFLEFSMWLVPFLLLSGMTLGIYYYSVLELKYRYFILYFAICLLIDIVSRIAGDFYGNNLLFLVVFSLLELLFFYKFYSTCFFKRKIPKHFVAILIACMYMIGEIYVLSTTRPEEFQSYSKTLGSFIILLMVIDFMFEMLNKKQFNNELLKFNSILIIYFSINLIFFLPVNFLINAPSHIKFYFWFVHLIMTIIFYLFILIGIWKNGVKRKPLQRGL